MSETKEPNDQSARVADEMVRRFLLGELRADEQDALATRLMVDEDFASQVRMVELELVDDYAFRRLSPAEHHRFESNFLVTADRRRKLIVSRALERHYSTAAQNRQSIAGTTAWSRISAWFSFERPVVGFALAVVVLLIFGGIIWLRIKQRRPDPTVFVSTAPSSVASPNGARSTVPTPLPSDTPGVKASPQSTPRTTPTAEPNRPVLATTFLLLPNALRDGGQMTRVVLPPDTHDLVRLQLSLEDRDPKANYRAELLTAEGLHVANSGSLKVIDAAATARVNFDVPASFLKAGDYQVRLSKIRAGSIEGAGRYYFRVTQ